MAENDITVSSIRKSMYHSIFQREFCHIRFSASLSNIDRVCRQLERFLSNWGLENLSFDIILGSREALNNAVIHGSGNDENMAVDFRVQMGDGQLTIRVVDQGQGFDYESVSKACVVTNECGRGICILEQYFDDVCFTPPGNAVRLLKSLDDCSFLGEMAMKEILTEGDLAIVKLDHDIVSSTIDTLRTEFKKTLEGDVSRLRLDLEDVRFIDSMGLGLLVATHNSLQKNGARLELANVSDDIQKLLRQMRLDKHFDVE